MIFTVDDINFICYIIKRKIFRCYEMSLGNLLDVQEKLIKARDCMDKLRSRILTRVVRSLK